MKVWNVCLAHHTRYAGIHRAVEDFARACDGPILSFDPTASTDREESAGRVHVLSVKGWPDDGPYWLSRMTTWKAANLLQDADGVIVHSLFRAHSGFIADWARSLGKPYWIVPHGCLDPWGLARRRLAKQLWLSTAGRKVFAGCAGVIFSTTRERDKAAGRIGLARSLVTAWPVDQPDLRNAGALGAQFRRRHQIPPDARLLLYVGRLHTMKRPKELIDVFHSAAASTCHLAIVGMDGDVTAEDLRRYANSLGASHVHITGGLYGRELAACMAAADAFISLSYRENFGYAAVDALAAGLPVILSPGHDVAHDLPLTGDSPTSCGWLLEGDPAESAIQAIRNFATQSRQDIVSRGHAARSLARRLFGRAQFEQSLRSELVAGVCKSQLSTHPGLAAR
jgi:glycosyltransferase involved in cell wall biosynthesis